MSATWGCVDVGGNLPLFTGFLTKETWIRAFIGLWLRQRKSISIIDHLKPMDSVKIRSTETCLSASTTKLSRPRQFVEYSNIRRQIADSTRQTYGDIWFDESTIRHRIFEYSGLTESKFRSLIRITHIDNGTPFSILRPLPSAAYYSHLAGQIWWRIWRGRLGRAVLLLAVTGNDSWW